MDTFADDRELLERLVERPGETLNVEIKAWLDPAQVADAAKIIKACLALRNRNGGHLVIGFQTGHWSLTGHVNQLTSAVAFMSTVSKY